MRWIHGVNRWLVVLLGVLGGGCSSAVPEPKAEATSSSKSGARAGDFLRPARIFPAEAWSGEEAQVIASGLRAERDGTGRVRVARDLIPGNDETFGIPLPDRLGGGYLFVSRGQQTSLWRAETWTAPLEPLATVEARANRIEPGFDRIYVLSRRETRAFDASSGEGVDLGPLPPAVSYQELRFGSGWTAVVEVPLSGVLATFDGGQQWWPVPGARSVVGDAPGLVLGMEGKFGRLESVRTDSEYAELQADGTLRPVSLRGEEEAAEGESASTPSPQRSGDLLRAAVLRGAYLGQNGSGEPRAAVVQDGDLVLVGLNDASVQGRERGVVSPGTVCQAITLGQSAGFVCQPPQGGTTIAVLDGERWRVVAELAGARPVLSAGSGGALFEGPCSGNATESAGVQKKAHRVICRVTNRETSQLSIPREALVVSSRQGVRGVVPPRHVAEERSKGASKKAADGVSSKGASSKKAADRERGALLDAKGGLRPLELPDDADSVALLTTGQWLLGGTEAPDGRLAFWVVGSDRFAGVLVDEEGRVEVGPFQKAARRAAFSGRFGLLWGAAGFAKETVDGGQSWHETSFPYRTGDSDPTQPPDERTPVEVGCSAAGCVLGPWIRVGWNAQEPRKKEAWGEASVPAVRPMPGTQGGRWRLKCRPSGRSSRIFAEDLRPPRQRSLDLGSLSSVDRESSAAWQSFWEWRPPALGARTEGYSLGSHLERTRLYAWGPQEGAWGERGKIQVAYVDPFSIEPVVVTPSSRAPWSDARRAALAFGDGGQTGISHVYAALDPSYEGGLLLLRSSTDVELFVFERERGPSLVRGAAELGLSTLDDAVKVGDVWYTTQRSGSNLRLLRVRGGQIEEAGVLSFGRADAPWVRIMRSVGGRHLGLWAEGDEGQVVYSLDRETLTLGEAVAVPRLGHRLQACPDQVEGYLLSVEVSPTPQVLVAGTRTSVDVSRIVAQFVVGGPEPCVTQLSAGTRDRVQPSASAPEGASGNTGALLTVTEQREGGRRWEMMCE